MTLTNENYTHGSRWLNHTQPPALCHRCFQIDNVSQGNVNWNRFSHKCNPKMDMVVPGTLFWPQQRDIFILEKNLQRSMRSQCKEEALPNELKVGNLYQHLQCPATWWYTRPSRWLEEIKHWSLVRYRPLLCFQNLFKTSKHPYTSFSTCCYSLFTWINVLTPKFQFSESKPPSKTHNCHGSFLRLRRRVLSILSFFNGTCFRISTRWSSVRSTSWWFNNSKTPSVSIICMNLHTWLTILGLEARNTSP